jgi:hypothetical protein
LLVRKADGCIIEINQSEKLETMNPPTNGCNVIIRAAYHSFSGVICAVTVMLVAFSAQGQNLFVNCWGNNTIVEITPAGAQSTFASGFPESLQGLAFNSAGDLFVSVTGTDGIYEFTPGGVRSTFAPGIVDPFQMAFNSAGDLFVASSPALGVNGGNDIIEITPSGVQSTFASGLNEPTGLAFNSAGDLFEVDSGSGNIYEFTPGGVRSTFASGLSDPYRARRLLRCWSSVPPHSLCAVAAGEQCQKRFPGMLEAGENGELPAGLNLRNLIP